jgi:hypothetical protein
VQSIAQALSAVAAKATIASRRAGRALVVSVLAASFLISPSGAYAAWGPSSYQMLVEQVASQRTITALINNEVASLYIGRCRVRKGIAVAPVTVRFRNGTSMLGTLALKQYKRRWYFYSITAGPYSGGVSNVSVPAGITTGIMRTAVAQQTTNQSFALGILYGRFRTITIQRISRNWNTATVRVRLSGGTSRARNGQISCLRKDATSGKQYWFFAAVR